jgi:hypothetical protein
VVPVEEIGALQKMIQRKIELTKLTRKKMSPLNNKAMRSLKKSK